MNAEGQRRRGGAVRRRSGDKLHKLMISVQELVKNQTRTDEHQHLRESVVKTRMRRQVRREKRILKKRKKKASSSTDQLELFEEPKRSALKQNSSEAERTEEEPRSSALKQNPSTVEKKPNRKVKFEKISVNREEKSRMEQLKRRKTLMEANEAEDREIRKLEKRLGLHKRRNKQKLPQSFISDGLDYVLGILEPGAPEMFQSDDELESSMKKSREEELEKNSGGEEKEVVQEEEELEPTAEEEMEEHLIQEQLTEPAAEGGDEDDEDDEDPQSNSESTEGTGGKYLPPQLRNVTDAKHQAELQRLKRNLKGLINRLSETNMSSISGQVEEMYMSCSRRDMNQVLTELLMAACVTPALMPDRLLMEHMLLVSVLHHTVGLEVGAHFLEAVARRFDENQRRVLDEGKECANLACMMAHLYNFQVVHSLLLFDLLKRLLLSFTERDVELVLLLLKNVGFSLRRDDPLALKQLISDAQHKASTEGQRFSDQNRVRFMLENMLALKNNDMRKIPGYDPEPMERLKKLQRTLIQKRAGGSDVKLRVSLENLLEAQQVGRWWIVGSSWSGAPMIGEVQAPEHPVQGEQFSAKVLELAHKQRMNTEVRRNIFCIIMTSEDYLHAFDKLLRLGLKAQQERDIIHVLLDCCLQERTFNPFYAVLAEKFCSYDRRFQMTLQFSLWDKMKDLDTLSGGSFSNLVQILTHLLQKNSLSVSVLKVIEFGELDKLKVKFLRQILSRLFQQTQPDDLLQIFSRISGVPKLEMLREGLKLFIRHFLLRNEQTEGTLLTERSEVVIKAIDAHDTKLKL